MGVGCTSGGLVTDATTAPRLKYPSSAAGGSEGASTRMADMVSGWGVSSPRKVFSRVVARRGTTRCVPGGAS